MPTLDAPPVPVMMDEATFTELFRVHHQEVFRFLVRISGDGAAAEDVLQQVFMNLWTARARIELADPIRPLLFRMARNAWLNVRRAVRIPPLPATEPASGPDRTADLERRVAAAVADMDPNVREAFVLSRHHGMTYPEIAKVQEVGVKAVEARLSRALHLLRERLDDYVR